MDDKILIGSIINFSSFLLLFRFLSWNKSQFLLPSSIFFENNSILSLAHLARPLILWALVELITLS